MCLYALDEDGNVLPAIAEALGDVAAVDVLVLDRIEFTVPHDDVPVLRGGPRSSTWARRRALGSG